MKTTHYLQAVSAAIEKYQQALDGAFEAYSRLLLEQHPGDKDAVTVLDVAYEAECARAHLTFMETRMNLRKWPRQ